MTCIVNAQRFPTKKSLKEALAAGQSVVIQDPSIFNPRTIRNEDMQDGESIIVTNHPKRSWFGCIKRKGDKFIVT